MAKRLLVQINANQLAKLEQVKRLRADLSKYPNSRIVHLLLQERLAQLLNDEGIAPHADGHWMEYIREKMPLYLTVPIALGAVRRSQEMIGKAFTQILVDVEPDKIIWCNYKADLEEIGEHLIATLRDRAQAERHYGKHERMHEELAAFFDSLSLDGLSDEQLAQAYTDIYERLLRFYGLTFDIDAIDHYLENTLKRAIGRHATGKRAAELYATLTTPSEPSYVAQEEAALRRLATDIERRQPGLLAFDTGTVLGRLEQDLRARLDSLVQRFWWTDLSWIGGDPKDAKSFIARLKSVPEQRPSVPNPEEKERVLDELDDEDLRHYVAVSERYARYHDYRKELQMKSSRALKLLLLELARSRGVKFEDLAWCWPQELLACTKGASLPEGLEKRKGNYLFIVTEKDVEEHFDEAALRMRRRELGVVNKGVSNLQGISASKGKAIGTARICYSSPEAQKVKAGDILVASMTMPDYLPAMKRAAAVVTNEGGVTCHAAIVSRELGIPCLVGTVMATSVIDDGDTIEVDANHGVVRIVERK